MCKTLFISDGPSQRKIEEKYEKEKNKGEFKTEDEREKYEKEEEIYFTTLGLGKITGIVTNLNYQGDGILVVTLKITKIGQDVVHSEKIWNTYYDPYTRTGMFYYKE